MFEQTSAFGFDVYQPFGDIDQWVLDFRNGDAFHGSFREIVKHMIENLGFESQEIDEAISCLCKASGHNAIHFGIYKKFIFSFKKEVDWEKVS